MSRTRPLVFLTILSISLLLLGGVIAADSDGDGYDDEDDKFPSDDQQWNDTDGDGFGDNPVMPNGDGCIDIANSGNQGCPATGEVSDKIQGEVGTPAFSITLIFAIILGVFLGVKGRGMFSAIEEDETEGHYGDEDEYHYGILGLLLVICILLLSTSITTHSLSNTEIVSNSDHDENTNVFITTAVENTQLIQDDLNGDGTYDVFYADYDADYGGNDTLVVQITAILNVTGPDQRVESMIQHRNIIGTQMDPDTVFTVYPWVEGDYSATIWVNVLDNENEGDSDNGNFGNMIVTFEGDFIVEPDLEVSGEDEVIEGEECSVEVTVSDTLHEKWHSVSGVNAAEDYVYDYYYEPGIDWLVLDFIEPGVMMIDCSNYEIGTHLFQVEYTSYFGHGDEDDHWLNVTAPENSSQSGNDTGEGNETEDGNEDGNNTGEGNETEDGNEDGNNTIFEPQEPVNVNLTIAVYQENQFTDNFGNQNQWPLDANLNRMPCAIIITTMDDRNTSVIRILETSSANILLNYTPEAGYGTVTTDCSEWDSKVYHLSITSVGVGGEQYNENLTIVIADESILAMAEEVDSSDQMSSGTLKQALTYLAGLSIAITLGVGLAVGFIHNKMFNQESLKGDMHSDMVEFKNNSNRR